MVYTLTTLVTTLCSMLRSSSWNQQELSRCQSLDLLYKRDSAFSMDNFQFWDLLPTLDWQRSSFWTLGNAYLYRLLPKGFWISIQGRVFLWVFTRWCCVNLVCFNVCDVFAVCVHVQKGTWWHILESEWITKYCIEENKLFTHSARLRLPLQCSKIRKKVSQSDTSEF